jgi:hypothetical protein
MIHKIYVQSICDPRQQHVTLSMAGDLFVLRLNSPEPAGNGLFASI